MRKLTTLLLMTAATAFAQSFEVGIIGGAPFSDVVKSTTVSSLQTIATSNNFTIGPSLRVNLPASLRIEGDALYRPYGFNFLSLAGLKTAVSGQQWRFPVLLQYRFKAPIINPFVEAGLSFKHLSGISAAAKSVVATGPGALLHQSGADFVIGAGVDVKVPFIKVSGELRYSRATVSEFSSVSNLNTAEVLFGFHF